MIIFIELFITCGFINNYFFESHIAKNGYFPLTVIITALHIAIESIVSVIFLIKNTCKKASFHVEKVDFEHLYS